MEVRLYHCCACHALFRFSYCIMQEDELPAACVSRVLLSKRSTRKKGKRAIRKGQPSGWLEAADEKPLQLHAGRESDDEVYERTTAG